MKNVMIEIWLDSVTCCTCGTVFGILHEVNQRLLRDGGSFFCPNGHKQWYVEPEVEKLKKQLAEAKRQTALYHQWYDAEKDDHQTTRRRLSAAKGVLTRTRKRVAGGVCPECNRHFENLHRHMQTKHPHYVEEEPA